MTSIFIPLHAHGPNRMARDETPYPPTRSWVLSLFYGSPLFLLRNLLLLSRGSLGEASQGFILLSFIFCQLLFPSKPLAPSSHKVRYNPLLAWKTQCPNQCMGWMRGKKMKSGKYGGNERWPFMNPPSGNSNPIGTNLIGNLVIPPRCGQVERHKVQAHVRSKNN